MELQLIRHATVVINVEEQQLLIDPMFSLPGTLSAVPDVKNTANNPLTALPVELSCLLEPSAVLLTHTHRDHFDTAAIDSLPKNTPILCQPADIEKLNAAGFSELLPVEDSREWQGMTIYRTGGQHGTGEIGKSMGPVSGYVLEAGEEPRIYITGDTIWCTEVEQALQQHKPDIVVCFNGEARFSSGDPITMGKEDIGRICHILPQVRVIVVHMEAWNHCGLTRQELRDYLQAESLADRVYIPEDGEKIEF